MYGNDRGFFPMIIDYHNSLESRFSLRLLQKSFLYWKKGLYLCKFKHSSPNWRKPKIGKWRNNKSWRKRGRRWIKAEGDCISYWWNGLLNQPLTLQTVLLTSWYPLEQMHLKEPLVLTHCWLQRPSVWHSSISTRWRFLEERSCYNTIQTVCDYFFNLIFDLLFMKIFLNKHNFCPLRRASIWCMSFWLIHKVESCTVTWRFAFIYLSYSLYYWFHVWILPCWWEFCPLTLTSESIFFQIKSLMACALVPILEINAFLWTIMFLFFTFIDMAILMLISTIRTISFSIALQCSINTLISRDVAFEVFLGTLFQPFIGFVIRVVKWIWRAIALTKITFSITIFFVWSINTITNT